MFNLGISDLLQQLCFASFAATVVALKSLFHLGERSDEVMHLLTTTPNDSPTAQWSKWHGIRDMLMASS